MPGGASSSARGTSSSATGAAGATGSGNTVSPSATGSTGAAGAVVRPVGRLACFAVGRAAGRSAGLDLAVAFGAALGAAARLRGADMVITPVVDRDLAGTGPGRHCN